MSLLIAHRGASSEAPENTLAAFQRALDIGVDGLELDVHLSADGQLVVIHDAIVGRTCWGAAGKRISDMTLAEIQSLDAGSWFGKEFAGERVPTLAEVLALDRKGAGLMIEVKRGNDEIEPLAEAVVREVAADPSLIVGSFSVQLLERIKQLKPELSLIGIVEDPHLLQSFDALKPARMALGISWQRLRLSRCFKKRGSRSGPLPSTIRRRRSF